MAERPDMDPRHLLDTAMREANGATPSSSSAISTSEVLVRLGKAWPGPLSAEQEAELEALCRKVHVARRVTTYYREGWKKAPDAPSISALQWRLLIVVLIAYGASQNLVSEEGRGMALKSINAAFAALDLARAEMDASVQAALVEGAESMLTLVLEAGEG